MAHTDPHHGHGVSVDASAGHEVTDANLGGVEKIITILVIFLGVAFGLMWLLFGYFTGREASQDVKPSPVAHRQGDRQPPLPRLQTTPYTDLGAFHRAEDEQLRAWKWADQGRGFAQIPVSRAIDILAEQGLPTPPPAQAAPTPPSGVPAPRGRETPAQQPGGNR